jgi:LmbE family N-acetylglucosaminyl deacetylase
MLLPVHTGGEWQMRVAVVSPHLDDAVLSVGGTIHGLTARGASVTVVTVFAGDPDASTPPSYWDAARGEASQGAAVRVRRREDEAATAELGARALALPWPDSGYVAARDPAAIWQQLGPPLDESDAVLLPGWPLSHADHRYATLLTLERIDRRRPIVFYAEEPYATEPITLLKGAVRNRTVAPLRHALGAEIRWRRNPIDSAGRAAQRRALVKYRGELQTLGFRGRWGRAYRRVAGGEWLGTCESSVVLDSLGLM